MNNFSGTIYHTKNTHKIGPKKLIASFRIDHFFCVCFGVMSVQPIHKAAEIGDVAGVRAALSAGVDVNILGGDYGDVCASFCV